MAFQPICAESANRPTTYCDLFESLMLSGRACGQNCSFYTT